MSPLPAPGAVLRPRPPDSVGSCRRIIRTVDGAAIAPQVLGGLVGTVLGALIISIVVAGGRRQPGVQLDGLDLMGLVGRRDRGGDRVDQDLVGHRCRSSMAEATPPVATPQKTTVKRLGSVAPFSESPPMTMEAESAPVTNCRMVRPREMRAMNMPAKGVQEIRQAQGAGRSDQGVHRPRVDGPVEHGRAQSGADGSGRLRVDSVRRGQRVEVERFTDSVKNQSNAHSRSEHRGDPGSGGVLGLLGVSAQGDRAEPGGFHDSTSTVRPARQGGRPTPPETAC